MTVQDGAKLVALLCVPAVAFFVRVLLALLSEEKRLWHARNSRRDHLRRLTGRGERKQEGLILMRGRMTRGRAAARRFAQQLGKPLL